VTEISVSAPWVPAAHALGQHDQRRRRQEYRRRQAEQQPDDQRVPHNRRLERQRPRNVTVRRAGLTPGTVSPGAASFSSPLKGWPGSTVPGGGT
jgi:hypothetical protein